MIQTENTARQLNNFTNGGRLLFEAERRNVSIRLAVALALTSSFGAASGALLAKVFC